MSADDPLRACERRCGPDGVGVQVDLTEAQAAWIVAQFSETPGPLRLVQTYTRSGGTHLYPSFGSLSRAQEYHVSKRGTGVKLDAV